MPTLRADDDDEDDSGDLESDIAGWSPSPMPPIGPDGGPILSPAHLPVIKPEGQGLCVDGPGGVCVNYHRMVVSFDAQRPLDGSDPEHEPQKVVHTCYPAPGIEVDLGGEHVFECTRYTPSSPRAAARLAYGDPSTPSTPPRAAPRSDRATAKKRRPGRR